MNLDELRASPAAVLTPDQVASVLGTDARTLRRACADGQLPCIRVGRLVRIPREPLIALLTAPTNSDGPDATSGPTAHTEPMEGASPHGATNQLRSA